MELGKIRLYLKRELDKWDRVEHDLANGGVADFMAIDHILDVLPPVVRTLVDREVAEARLKERQEARNIMHLHHTEKPKLCRQLEDILEARLAELNKEAE